MTCPECGARARRMLTDVILTDPDQPSVLTVTGVAPWARFEPCNHVARDLRVTIPLPL